VSPDDGGLATTAHAGRHEGIDVQATSATVRERPEGAPAGTRYLLRKRLLRASDTMAIERDGDTVALEDGGRLDVEGNILDHEYQVTRDGIPVANISKRWFRVRDTDGVAVVPGQDDALVVAITVGIDHLTGHDG
jgi:uncharacterized protein YxjI